MLTPSALFGAGVGVAIHAFANGIAKNPLARYPWMYVVMGGGGAYLVPYMDEKVAAARKIAEEKQKEKMEKNYKF